MVTLSANKRTIRFNVDVNENHVGSYVVNSKDDKVDVVVDGRRYRLDLNARTVESWILQDVEVNTMDFSTQYTPQTLRDVMVKNIQQWMLGEIVHAMSHNN